MGRVHLLKLSPMSPKFFRHLGKLGASVFFGFFFRKVATKKKTVPSNQRQKWEVIEQVIVGSQKVIPKRSVGHVYNL